MKYKKKVKGWAYSEKNAFYKKIYFKSITLPIIHLICKLDYDLIVRPGILSNNVYCLNNSKKHGSNS